MSGTVQLTVPEKLEFLFKPAPFKVLWGGRGSAKSHTIAKALLVTGYQTPLRILCTREIQKSMRDSVHKLLKDQIALLGLQNFYTVQNETILGANGTEFMFAGLRHNIDSIKSKEGIDRVWVEEAQTVTKESWETLLPTIRKDAAEVWISFNPKLNTDDTYKRWVLRPPTGSIVVKVNWSDNPWFPKGLMQQMLDAKERDYDEYLNVWEGHCRQTLEGAVYAEQIRAATKAGQFGEVPWDSKLPVDLFFDLGISDATVVWMVQKVGNEFHVIDYHSARGRSMEWHSQELRKKPYKFGRMWLPHDARAREKSSGRTIEGQMKTLGWEVHIVPNIKLVDGISALRSLFPQMWWDAGRCAEGLEHLRLYSYDVSENGTWSTAPLHDEHSHAADAARYIAVAMRTPGRRTKRRIMAR